MKLLLRIIRWQTLYLLEEVGFFVNHYLSCFIFRMKKFPGVQKLHLGSGPVLLKGFLNIDLAKPADLRLDLRRKFPFKDSSMTFIFSEHVFEHLSYPYEITTLLKECYRVLKVNGKLYFNVPDFDRLIRSYYSDKRMFKVYRADLKARVKNFEDIDSWTDRDYLDILVRQWGEHKYLYQYATFQRLLRSVGFRRVARRSKCRYDSRSRLPYSLLIGCVK